MPDPVPADGEVLVDVTRLGEPTRHLDQPGHSGTAASLLPWIPGTEGAGTVDGQPVLVHGGGLGMVRHGVFATKVAAPADAVVTLPAGTDPATVAGLGVAGVTAWNCVHTLGACTADDRVLVLGASGGVGSLAVQIAVASGATVWGQTSSASKVAAVESLGASRVVVTDADGLAAATDELAHPRHRRARRPVHAGRGGGAATARSARAVRGERRRRHRPVGPRGLPQGGLVARVHRAARTRRSPGRAARRPARDGPHRDAARARRGRAVDRGRLGVSTDPRAARCTASWCSTPAVEQARRHGSTTSQPRRCSSPASCSAGIRRSSCSALDSRSPVQPAPRGLVRRRLQSSDQLVCLGPRELARSLALREPHRSAGIPEALVTRRVQQLQQLVHLT